MSDFGIDFLRPWWLLGMVPWVCALLIVLQSRQGSSGWEHVVDPVLQPYVIEPDKARSSMHKWWLLLAWLICLLTLSGPVWQKQEVPV